MRRQRLRTVKDLVARNGDSDPADELDRLPVRGEGIAELMTSEKDGKGEARAGADLDDERCHHERLEPAIRALAKAHLRVGAVEAQRVSDGHESVQVTGARTRLPKRAVATTASGKVASSRCRMSASPLGLHNAMRART
jgi:hypothetical protein